MRKVVSLSFDQKLHNEMVIASRKQNLSLSQYIRDLYKSRKQQIISSGAKSIETALHNVAMAKQDIALIGLAVINCGPKVLIVRRSEPDKIVNNLNWSFPGGKLQSISVKKEMDKILNVNTGLSDLDFSPIASRYIPDVTPGSLQIIAVYFAAEVKDQELHLSDKYSEHYWIDPMDIYKYFTTSVADEVTAYLANL